jgi:hypothetical protein
MQIIAGKKETTDKTNAVPKLFLKRNLLVLMISGLELITDITLSYQSFIF